MDILKQKIHPSIYKQLSEGTRIAGIDSLKTILLKNELTLCQCTKLNQDEIRSIIQEAADIVLKQALQSASEVPAWPRLFTGCDSIDSVIRHGIPVNGITEIVGPSGVGKTQLCLQLSLTAQFPLNLGGLDKGVVYICTEDTFPSKRLTQLVKTFPLQFTELEKIKFGDNIYIQHVSDFEQLRRCLYIRLPQLLVLRKIGLIIIDSIAGAFRSENIDVNYTNRSQELYTIASQLNKLGEMYGVAIVCTNQVTDNIDTGTSEPCLGLAWSNLITCRFGIRRHFDSVRLFEIIFAPDLRNISCKFIIKDYGLDGIKNV